MNKEKDLYDKIVEETATYKDFQNFMARFYTRRENIDPDKLLELYRKERKNRGD